MPLLRFLDQIPLKLMVVVIVLGLYLNEWYPFSSFPMYSRFSGNTFYVYVTDGRDRPLPLVPNFGIKGASLKRIYRSHVKARSGRDAQAAFEVLMMLNERMRARGVPSPSSLKLWQVNLSLHGGEVVQNVQLLGELPILPKGERQ